MASLYVSQICCPQIGNAMLHVGLPSGLLLCLVIYCDPPLRFSSNLPCSIPTNTTSCLGQSIPPLFVNLSCEFWS